MIVTQVSFIQVSFKGKKKKISSFWHKHILQANIQTGLITSYWIMRSCRPIVPICPRADHSLFIELTSNTKILFLNHSAYSLKLISGLQAYFSCSLRNANYINAISVGLLLLFCSWYEDASQFFNLLLLTPAVMLPLSPPPPVGHLAMSGDTTYGHNWGWGCQLLLASKR